MTTLPDPIQLEVFKHRFAAIAEEMGAVLRKASFSPNIKERRDFSCALFDAQGKMVAQAAHIPVHLGSMPMSVEAAIREFPKLEQGDVIIVNDPYRGGTHLPDITMVSPVFVQTYSNLVSGDKPNQLLFGFVASRAHHSDVGGMSPGSMPIAREIFQEGIIIPPIKLISCGLVNQAVWDLLIANVRTADERAGDLWAQVAANKRGTQRLQELVNEHGMNNVNLYMVAMLDYTERMTRNLLESIPDGIYSFSDTMDNDGVGNEPVIIKVSIKIQGDQALVDFTGSAHQQRGSINAVYAITLSAVYYVFRCLIGLDVPNNAGCLVPIQVIAPEKSVVNAQHPSPVAGGNVETSQRITTLEATTGFEPVIKVLQTSALPLGHVAIRVSAYKLMNLRGDDRIRTGDKGFADLCLTTWPRRQIKKADRFEDWYLPLVKIFNLQPAFLERATGFEPVAFSLARRRYTT
jgi:N-methylhydantoinase B